MEAASPTLMVDVCLHEISQQNFPVELARSTPLSSSKAPSLPDGFCAAILSHIPTLRAFAITLAGRRSEADDLVQEALTRAWKYRYSFQDGSNMKSWLRKILLNCFYQDLPRQRLTVQDVEGRLAAQQAVQPSQEWRVRYNEMLAALLKLNPEIREALLLIVADGHSYEEAALISHCPTGTLKSRVNRAREQLGQLMDEPPAKHARHSL